MTTVAATSVREEAGTWFQPGIDVRPLKETAGGDIADAGHRVVGDRNDAFTAVVIHFVDQLDEPSGGRELAS